MTMPHFWMAPTNSFRFICKKVIYDMYESDDQSNVFLDIDWKDLNRAQKLK